MSGIESKIGRFLFDFKAVLQNKIITAIISNEDYRRLALSQENKTLLENSITRSITAVLEESIFSAVEQTMRIIKSSSDQ